jgi:plasminogen activator inhibitor 1 RNA-binding protein
VEVDVEAEGAAWIIPLTPQAKTSTKTARVKKEKVYIEVDGQFAQPAGRRDGDRERPQRTGGDRGDREGGFRGERSERGRGAPRGRGGPRGAPRGAGAGGAPRGGARGAQSAPIDANDTSAFPALGA